MAERPGNDPGLIPAGPKLREAKQITWPISQFKMSLVGFDHVFATGCVRAPGERFLGRCE
jgi:hypothetical protein